MVARDTWDIKKFNFPFLLPAMHTSTIKDYILISKFDVKIIMWYEFVNIKQIGFMGIVVTAV